VGAEVLRIRETSNNAWGGRKIAHGMERAGAAYVPAQSTITEILRTERQARASADHVAAYPAAKK
jgi:hypothetical protein